jgi:hypothetical protein
MARGKTTQRANPAVCSAADKKIPVRDGFDRLWAACGQREVEHLARLRDLSCVPQELRNVMEYDTPAS